MKYNALVESNLDFESLPLNVDESPSEKAINYNDSNIKKVCKFSF